MKYFFLFLLLFNQIFSDSQRFTETIYLVRIQFVNGTWEKGFLALSPEEELNEENRIMEVLKKKQSFKFFHFNQKVKKENLPHVLYNLPFYEVKYNSIFKLEFLEYE